MECMFKYSVFPVGLSSPFFLIDLYKYFVYSGYKYLCMCVCIYIYICGSNFLLMFIVLAYIRSAQDMWVYILAWTHSLNVQQ